MLSDLRLAARNLAKSRAFTIVAVSTLAVGIAATASLFTLVHALVTDPLPYAEPGQLVEVWSKDKSAPFDFMPLSVPDFLDLRERVAAFSEHGAFSVRRYNLGGDAAESVEGALCTAGLLPALGVRPLHGRWFTSEDERTDSRLAIVSHGLWQRRFAADPALVGRTIRLDGSDHTVVGIMPPGFRLLAQWTRNRELGVFTLLRLSHTGQSRGSYWMASIARVRSGVPVSAAAAEVRGVSDEIARAHPETNGRRALWLMPLARQIGGMAALRVSVLLAAGWTLLALAAQNVAGMLLARGVQRQGEMALRAALGAGRAHIVRLVLAESVLLALASSAVGMVLATWCLAALPRLLPREVLPLAGLHVDGTLVAAIFVLALVTIHMAGWAPALAAARADAQALRGTAGGAVGSERVRRRLKRLVIGQVAIALFLTTVALQLSATYRSMVASAASAASDRVSITGLAVKGDRYSPDARRAFWQRFVARAAALPGVLDAGVTTKLPFEGGVSMPVLTDDATHDAGRPPAWAEVSYVSPDFFAATGTSLLHGRLLADADDPQARPVVINRAMAEKYWPGRSPLGGRIRADADAPEWQASVVGVIGDVRQVAERPARPEMYFPFDGVAEEAFLVLRTAAGVTPPIAVLRQELRQLDSDLALGATRTLEAVFADNSRVLTTVTLVVDVLMVAILGLAALGVYGTISFFFAERRRELGVRFALGAQGRDVVLLVLRQALVWVAVGCGLGLVGSWAIATGLRAAVSDASGVDLVPLTAGVALIVAVALFAAYWPARRAARVDPIEALRCE